FSKRLGTSTWTTRDLTSHRIPALSMAALQRSRFLSASSVLRRHHVATGLRRGMGTMVMEADEVDLDSIAHIDINPLLAEHAGHPIDPATKQQILAQIKTASLEKGFFTIPTRGILPDDLIRQVYQRKTEFLALPRQVKMQYHLKKVAHERGWTPLYEEPSSTPGVLSRLEAFDVARDLPASYSRFGALGPNVWPRELPAFKRDVNQLYDATIPLSQTLFKSFAEMLGQPSNLFLQHSTEKAEAMMRLLTYPETDEPVKNSTVGICSHTDYECFTILHQNGHGLQIFSHEGHWIKAPVSPDRLLVMVGDVLERWTNGLLKATPHRVVNTHKRRQSIARLNGVDGDTIIGPMAPFVSASNPPRYPYITQREHIDNQVGFATQTLEATKQKKAQETLTTSLPVDVMDQVTRGDDHREITTAV
ncbi:TPA: hypothetical protein N0F65_005408, partial [Lagenidium giganteum]